MALSALRRDFMERGYAVVPGALDADAVAAFVAQLAADGGCGDLHDPSRWPAGKARRVAEAAPLGGPQLHWATLTSSPAISSALDALLGEGAWRLPLNAGDDAGKLTGPRHWYAPVTYPEQQVQPVERGEARCLPPRVCPFCAATELRHSGSPEAAWVPISRRRWAGLGWHLDVGPGFPNDGPRRVTGHPLQGAVLLVLLSDWGAGDGGTVMLPGSHRWVLSEMLRRDAAGEPPATHEDLNTWCVQRMRAATEAGRVLLPSCRCAGFGSPPQTGADEQAAAASCAYRAQVDAALAAELARPIGEASSPLHPPAPPAELDTSGAGALPTPSATQPALWCEQIVGRAGDVVLMHPLTLHCGTSNCSSRPARVRLMANGCAVVTTEAFDRDGGTRPMLALLPEALRGVGRAS